MTNIDAIARDAVEGRRRRAAPVAGCSRPMATTAADTLRHFPNIMAALHAAEMKEDQRRLHINDSFAVRRFGDRIVASVGALNVELSVEEARRAADALSFYAATADAVDVEDDEMGRAA